MTSKRRQAGEGSYYEKDGRQFYQAPRIPGTKYRPTVSAKTKAELRLRKKELDARLASNLPLDSQTTLNQFLDTYMNGIKQDIDRSHGKIRNSTYTRNVNCLEPIRQLLGEMKLSQLKLQHIEQAYREAKSDHGKPYAPATIDRMHAILHGALQKAVAWDLIAKNPTVGAERPKGQKQEMLYLTLEEVQELLSIEDRLQPLWHLLIFTGLRQGEARALRWDDYNGRELDINGTLVPNYGAGGMIRTIVKTRDGNRVVPIDPDLRSSLERHRTAQKREKLAAGPLWVETGYIFTANDGRPYWGNNLLVLWKRAVAQVTDKPIVLHGTRHTAAYLHMNHLGTSDFELSKLLGHSSPSITYRNYGHFRQERATETADKMGALLRRQG